MLPKPKRGSTPTSFYNEYLPQLWRALVGDQPLAMSDMAVAIVLRDSDERFVTAVSDGVLVSGPGEAAHPIALFDSDNESWRIALLDLLPRLLKHIELRLTQAPVKERLGALNTDALRQCPGVITVTYEDDAGDQAVVNIVIAGGGPRRATIEASDTELWKLLEGGGRLSQLVTSRVRIGGDVAYVLELARLLEN